MRIGESLNTHNDHVLQGQSFLMDEKSFRSFKISLAHEFLATQETAKDGIAGLQSGN